MTKVPTPPDQINTKDEIRAEYTFAESVPVVLYGTATQTYLPGYPCHLGQTALWLAKPPQFWNGEPIPATLDTPDKDAEQDARKRIELASIKEELLRREAEQDPIFSRGEFDARAARDAAKIIADSFSSTVEDAAHQNPRPSLESIKQDGSTYSSQKSRLRFIDYRLTYEFATQRIISTGKLRSRKEVNAYLKKYKPANLDEPFCEEYLRAWNGIIDLDLDGVFGWIAGKPAAQQLARKLPQLGIAGLIAAQQSPSGVGLNALVFVGKRNAPKTQREFQALYKEVEADIASYCEALGAKPKVDYAFGGRRSLLGTPRRFSPFPWYASPAKLEEVTIEPRYEIAEGVKRRRQPGTKEKITVRNDEPAKVRPWCAESVPLPPALTIAVEEDPLAIVSGWKTAKAWIAEAPAPKFEEIERKPAEEEPQPPVNPEEVSENTKNAAYEEFRKEWKKGLDRIRNAKPHKRHDNFWQAIEDIANHGAKRAYLTTGDPRYCRELNDEQVQPILDAIKESGSKDPAWKKPEKVREFWCKGWDKPAKPFTFDCSSEDTTANVFDCQQEPRIDAESTLPKDVQEAWDYEASLLEAEESTGTTPAKVQTVPLWPSLRNLPQAGAFIYGQLRTRIFYAEEKGAWYLRQKGSPTYRKQEKELIRTEIAQVLSIANVRVGKDDAHSEPWPQDLPALNALCCQLATQCRFNAQPRAALELRYDSVIYAGAVNKEIYLTRAGRTVTFDREKSRVTIADNIDDCVSEWIHLAVEPATKNEEGDLLTLEDLTPEDAISQFFSMYCGEDKPRRRRLACQCGRLFIRRPHFDSTTNQSFIFWYGVTGSGKSTLKDIVEACRGGMQASSVTLTQTALDVNNRFARASRFSAQNVYFDDSDFKPANLEAFLTMRQKEHSLEEKNKDPRRVDYSPTFVGLSNNPPPLKGNATAIGRRLYVYFFDKPITESQSAFWHEAFETNSTLQSQFIAVCCAEYLRQLREGIERTSDDAFLDLEIEGETPLRTWLSMFLQRSKKETLTRTTILSKYLRTEGIPEEHAYYAKKNLITSIRNVFGHDAVTVGKSNNLQIHLKWTDNFYRLQKTLEERRFAGENSLTLRELVEEEGLQPTCTDDASSSAEEPVLPILPATPAPATPAPATPAKPAPAKPAPAKPKPASSEQLDLVPLPAPAKKTKTKEECFAELEAQIKPAQPLEAVREDRADFARKSHLVPIDFEYQTTEQGEIKEIICAALLTNGDTYETFWLPENKDALIDCINREKAKGSIFVAHSIEIAEARAFLALGLTPYDYQWIDTCTTAKLLENWHKQGEAPQPLDLASVTTRYTGKRRDTAQKHALQLLCATAPREVIDRHKAEIMTYCAEDIADSVAIVIELEERWHTLSKRSIFGGTVPGFYTTARALARASAQAAVVASRGLPVDASAVERLRDDAPSIVDALKAGFEERWGFPFGKRKETLEKLEEEARALGIASPANMQQKALEGAFGTDSPFVNDYLETKEKTSLYGKLAKGWTEHLRQNRMMYGALNLYRAWTGRAGASPKSGFIPLWDKAFHHLMKAAPGRKLVEIDYSSEELYLAGALYRDSAFLDAYAREGDIYQSIMASLGAASPEDSTLSKADFESKYPGQRQKWKAVILGQQYGQGPRGLSQNLHCTEDEARDLLARLRGTFRVKEQGLSQTLNSFASEHGFALNLLPNGWGCVARTADDVGLSYRNFPIQASGAAILGKLLDRFLTQWEPAHAGAQIVATVHDAVILEVPEDDSGAVEDARQLMIQTVDDYLACTSGAKVNTPIKAKIEYLGEDK